MSNRSCVYSAGFCALLLTNSSLGELPADQQIILHLREVPDDPQSAIRTVIGVEITAVEMDATSVGWRIQRATFARRLSDGSEATWEALLPTINTPDGLWWIDHADAANPSAEEFTVLPWMIGTADSLDARYSDLEYDLIGAPDTTPPTQQVYANSGKLSYRLAADNSVEPVDDDKDDEPVEIPDTPNDPYLY